MPPKFRRREKAVTAATKIAITGGKKPHPETQPHGHSPQSPCGGGGPPALPHGMVAAGLQWFKAQHRPGADTPGPGAHQGQRP